VVRVALLVALLALVAGAAHAAGPRLAIERAELEPSWFPGLARLRLHATAVVLEGSTIPFGAGDDLALVVGGARRREPALIARTAGDGAGLVVALVVQVGWEYREDLPAIEEALAELLGGLPRAAEVAIVTYGEEVEGGRKFEPPAIAAGRLGRLDPDATPADPSLLAAVDRAVEAVGKREVAPGAPARRVVIVVSDGIDADGEPDAYRAAGERAAKRDVRILSLAYSPADRRRPLLGLGELSKRSGGTFRWVRSKAGWAGQIETTLDELGRPYVLTFFLPPNAVLGRRIALGFKDLTSNEVRLDALACGAATCGDDEFCAERRCVPRAGAGRAGLLRRALPWALGAIGGLFVLAFVVGLARARGGRAAPIAPPPPPAPPGTPPPPGAIAGRLAPVQPGQASSAPRAAAPVAAPTARRPAVLQVTSGPLAGRQVALRHGAWVGTAPGCDLVLAGDRHASGQHVQFLLDPAGDWVLVDRGSSNGTFARGVRVRELRLTHGAALRVGQTELRFLLVA
jgi:hypothetical protein